MGIQHIGSRVSIREETITLNAVPSSVYNKGIKMYCLLIFSHKMWRFPYTTVCNFVANSACFSKSKLKTTDVIQSIFPCVAFSEGRKSFNIREHTKKWGRLSTRELSKRIHVITSIRVYPFTQLSNSFSIFSWNFKILSWKFWKFLWVQLCAGRPVMC